MKKTVLLSIFTLLYCTVMAQNIPNGVTSPASATPKRTPIFFPDIAPYYQRSFIPLIPITDSAQVNLSATVENVAVTTAYFDQLGRPYESVSRQSSPAKKDIVQPYAYDVFNRAPIQYMPYVAQTGNTTDGKFKAQPYTADSAFYKSLFPDEQIYYGETVFDGSPFNEATKTLAPGNSWGGSNRGISSTHRANTLSDSVRLWLINITSEDDIPTTSAIYQAGSLIVQEVTDERGIKAVVYMNERGEKVMTKTQLSASPGTAHTGWLCTYYIYDEMGHLRYVIPPKATEAINNTTDNWNLATNIDVIDNLCYGYWYDIRNRLTVKHIPGKGKTYIAYDLWDRVVLTQDENLRVTNQWNFIKYDAQSRPLNTGLITITGTTAAQVQSNAAASTTYPTLSGTYTILSENYYDNYSWTSGTPLSSTIDNSGITSTNFYTTYNSSPEYAQPLTQSSRIRGSATGAKKLIIGTSTYLYTAVYYDEEGRSFQTKQTNISGGTDVATTQFSYSGLLLRSLLQHQKSGAGSQTHTALTKYTYDHAGRLKTLLKNIDNTGDKTLSSLTYNELGQTSSKIIGSNINGTNGETENFSFNIRGMLTGINKDYVNTANATGSWFGEILSYDFGFGTAQYNGNIAGVQWKGGSDGVARAYGYTYDNANRITKADFSQQNTGATAWTKDLLDFSVSGLKYDANGNITKMNQRGVNINTPLTIDSLSYTYFSNSNQLSKIKDNISDNTPWGDFKDTTLTNNDYVYDNNGNMLKDNNKHIHTTGGGNGITYNFLDKASTITVNSKGSINYTYDAAGILLQKNITDNTKGTQTVITYIAGFVYQKVLATGGNISTTPDTLQYALHEEGRIRPAVIGQTSPAAYFFDYFLKDHLGNIRSTVTEERKTDAYPLASLETANIATEKNYYSGLDNGIVDKSTVTSYPTNDTYTSPNNFIQKLNGNGTKIGAGILLKVMAGDKINVHASSWYKLNGVTPGTPVSPLTDIISALTSSIPGASSNKILQAQLTSTVLNPSVSNFVSSRDATGNTARPNAWLNIIVLDEQMNLVNTNDGKNSYFEQVGGGNTASVKAYNIANREITKSGYVYIYVSNETPNVDVYWDNLQVTQNKGPLLQENGFYPFGLEMAAIGSQAASGQSNNYKFNAGTELETAFDVDYYETAFRKYDAAIGRFNGIDAMAEATWHLTPYQFGSNNPVVYNDPTGLIASHYGSSETQQLIGSLLGSGYTIDGRGSQIGANGDNSEDAQFASGSGGGGGESTSNGGGNYSAFWDKYLKTAYSIPGNFSSTFSSIYKNGESVIKISYSYSISGTEGNGVLGYNSTEAIVGKDLEIFVTGSYFVHNAQRGRGGSNLGPGLSAFDLAQSNVGGDGGLGNWLSGFDIAAGVYSEYAHNHTTYTTTKGILKNIYKANGQIRSARAAGFARVSNLVRGVAVVGSIASTAYSGYKVVDQFKTGGIQNVDGWDATDAGVGLIGLGTTAAISSGLILASNPIGWVIGAGVLIYSGSRLAWDLYNEP